MQTPRAKNDLSAFDEVLLKNCPKIEKSINEYYSNQICNNNRGTNFRGVSRNGRSNWQILTMVDGHKIYLGTVENIMAAGILYDIVTI